MAGKYQLVLPQDGLDALERMAAARGVSKADVIRQAISHERFFFESVQKGGKVLVEDAQGRLVQVLL